MKSFNPSMEKLQGIIKEAFVPSYASRVATAVAAIVLV
jgi:hypothetical protein